MSFAEALMLMWFIALNLLPGECVPKAEGGRFIPCIWLLRRFDRSLLQTPGVPAHGFAGGELQVSWPSCSTRPRIMSIKLLPLGFERTRGCEKLYGDWATINRCRTRGGFEILACCF